MSKQCCEKFKTSIGGQALIEGIMMRGPESDAIALRKDGGIDLTVTPRKLRGKNSIWSLPFFRGCANFFDAQLTGVKALMYSAVQIPEEDTNEGRKDSWLERKLGKERLQKVVIGLGVCLGIGFSILLFFLLPMIISGFFDRWIESNLALHLLEGLIRMTIFMLYMILVSRMEEMKLVFGYHGAEHKTIRCYEANLPLTVENVREQTRLHPRCGTSFLLVIMVISILVFSAVSSLLLSVIPVLEIIRGTALYRVIMMVFKLLLLPFIVSVTYEINRWAGRHDNCFTRILTAPGMWMQKFTTQEPDDYMIEVAITALEAVIPTQKGTDTW